MHVKDFLEEPRNDTQQQVAMKNKLFAMHQKQIERKCTSDGKRGFFSLLVRKIMMTKEQMSGILRNQAAPIHNRS